MNEDRALARGVDACEYEPTPAGDHFSRSHADHEERMAAHAERVALHEVPACCARCGVLTPSHENQRRALGWLWKGVLWVCPACQRPGDSLSVGCLVCRERIGIRRGLCSRCHVAALRAVRAGKITWQSRIRQGLALPVKRHRQPR